MVDKKKKKKLNSGFKWEPITACWLYYEIIIKLFYSTILFLFSLFRRKKVLDVKEYFIF